MGQKVIQSNLAALSKRHQRIAKAIPQAVERAQKRIADEAIALHKKTVTTWKHKPRFYTRKTAKGFTINTDSLIYFWTDFGTKPHVIRAKNAPLLVFRWPYKAATKPRVISSTKAAYGKNWARRLMVHHPGTKPRHFTDEIVKRMKKRTGTIMREELNKASNVEARGL